jgi:hypothetical protein
MSNRLLLLFREKKKKEKEGQGLTVFLLIHSPGAVGS